MFTSRLIWGGSVKYTEIVSQGMYRFVHTDKKLENGKVDFRIQKWYDYPKPVSYTHLTLPTILLV